jgi:hypothetical protein
MSSGPPVIHRRTTSIVQPRPSLPDPTLYPQIHIGQVDLLLHS